MGKYIIKVKLKKKISVRGQITGIHILDNLKAPRSLKNYKSKYKS